jgi:predicted lipoprotein
MSASDSRGGGQMEPGVNGQKLRPRQDFRQSADSKNENLEAEESAGVGGSHQGTTVEDIRKENLVYKIEVLKAVTMKNYVFWDVTPCGSCKNRRFGGT